MSADMTELLNYSKALHDAGVMSDEKLARIEARHKSNELSKRIAKVHSVSGEEIKAIRARFGMSQAVLAQTLGMSKESVSKWERGEIKPSGPALRILNTLDARGPEVFTS